MASKPPVISAIENAVSRDTGNVRAVIADVTPEIAKHLLDNNPNNRRVHMKTVQQAWWDEYGEAIAACVPVQGDPALALRNCPKVFLSQSGEIAQLMTFNIAGNALAAYLRGARVGTMNRSKLRTEIPALGALPFPARDLPSGGNGGH